MTEPLDFGRIDPVYRGWAEDYLRMSGFDPATFLAAPQPAEDEMFFKALLPNFEGDRGIGAFKFVEATVRHYQALDQIVQQAFGGFDGVSSLLDFASGYGRLTRALLQRLPAERIWVSDIYAEAIDWQVRTFGVNGFASVPDPAALAHDRKHDVIFVGSLFSHLPAELFRAWLQRLHGLLTPDGVLAFSVHDESILPSDQSMDGSGIRFFPWSESGSLDPAIYGMTYVTETFVADAIARIARDRTLSWRIFHKGLYENQALYVVGGVDRDLSGLRVASPPMGGFERATLLTDGSVEFSGWAIERTPGGSLDLIVHVDGEPVLSANPTGDRPDIQATFPASLALPFGWSFRLSRAQAAEGKAIRLTMRSTTGLETHAYARMPSDPALTYSGWSRRALRQG
jgi:trans-aconitate methyltransferase